MDQSAIKQIQETSGITDIINHLNKQGLREPVALLPGSMSIQSLEEYMPTRASYRGVFKTNVIDDFVKYNKAYKQELASCFIDPKKMEAVTIFDMGSIDKPLHREHKAAITLDQTAAYRKILECDSVHYKQKDVCDLLEDWSEYITVFNSNNESLDLKKSIKAIRELTIESARAVNSIVSDTGSSMSAMEKIEAKNAHEIPTFINFVCEPFHGLEERAFTLRLSLLTSSDTPKFTLKIIRRESITEELSKEFKVLLESKLMGTAGINVYIGTF